MNTPTVLPNADAGSLRDCGENEYVRQGDVFVTPKDADTWIVTENGKNAVSLSSGRSVHCGYPTQDDLMEFCRSSNARLVHGTIHLIVGG